MGNPFCWMELSTHDLAGAEKFYKDVFDWEISEMPGGPMPYKIVTTGKDPGAGMMNLPEPGVPTSWMVYIEVEDVDAMCAKISGNGGKVWKETQEVPGHGPLCGGVRSPGCFLRPVQSLEQK
jgi:predicted enzyme related to lactoylglutathione lyase